MTVGGAAAEGGAAGLFLEGLWHLCVCVRMCVCVYLLTYLLTDYGEFCVTVGPVTRTADILTQSVIWRTWAVC